MSETTTRKPRTRKSTAPAAEVEQTVRETQGYKVDLVAEGTTPTRDFSKLMGKAPNATHAQFKEWFEAQDGVEVELDLKTIQVVLATYAQFQNSPEHKATTQAKRAESQKKAAEKEAAKLVKLQKAADELKALQAKAAKAAKVPVKA